MQRKWITSVTLSLTFLITEICRRWREEVGWSQEGWISERDAITIKHCSIHRQPPNRCVSFIYTTLTKFNQYSFHPKKSGMLEQTVVLKRYQSYCSSQSHEPRCTPKSSLVHQTLKFLAICNFINTSMQFQRWCVSLN